MSESSHRQRTTDEWNALIEAYLESGLTQKAFCQQHGIGVHRFRHRYQRSPLFRGKRRQKRDTGFTRVAVPEVAAATTRGWTVRYGARVQIDCPAGTTVEAIVQLARGLSHDA